MPQFLQIPTIGLVKVFIVVQGLLAARPAANGNNGFYFATDVNHLYLDVGTWFTVA